MEKLHELHDDGDFDLIVVDTPPTRHALDFLDAPQRLTRLLDNRIFRLLMMPTRAYLRVASVAVQTFLRTVARVVGSEVIDDVVAFFRAFEGMEEGFRERAQVVGDAARRPDDRVRARHLAAARRDARRRRSSPSGSPTTARRSQALIVNRVHPSFGDEAPAGLRAAAEALRAADADGDAAAPARRALRQPRRLPRDRRARTRAHRGAARPHRRRHGVGVRARTSPTTSTTSPRCTRSASSCSRSD